MFLKTFHWRLLWFFAVVLKHQGACGFFVKHVKTGMCINDTRIVQSRGSWGNVSFVELSGNCLDPAAQFRFRDNGAMLNLKRPGCLFPTYKSGGGGHSLDTFYLYVHSKGLDTEACAQRVDRNTDPAITQTSWGGLSLRYTRNKLNNLEAMCVVPKKDQRIANNPGIDPYIGFTRDCNDAEDKRFNFGSVTCHGNIVKNSNCPKDQHMVVKTASYRGLSGTKTCGLSDDYSCEVDVTCLVKKQCDGQQECSITVDNNLFSGDLCSGLTKYLYFEYQCVTGATSFNGPCVQSVSLSSSTLPNKGFLTVSINNEKNLVCSETLTNQILDIVCTQLGYRKRESQSSAVASSTLSKFSGSINCGGDEKTLSQCATTDSVQDCSKQSYLTCGVCDSPLLEHKDYFPDSSFKASASLSGHHPAMARISSDSSWCAPVSNGKYYLQVDLGRDYQIEYVATFGDSISRKWVSSYRLNYTSNSGLVQWKEASTQTQAIFRGNTNAYNYAAIQRVDNNIRARAVRFIPLDSVVQACMRIQICGKSIKPGKPHKLNVDQIQSTTVRISWLTPVVQSVNPISDFWIRVKQGEILIFNKPLTYKQKNNFIIDNNLSPFTKYNVSLKFGDVRGFGEAVSIEFTTAEAAPEGPPLNVTVTAQNSSSLSVTWKPPEEDKRNGKIVSYTVCISHEENKPCFKKYTTKEKMIVIENLNASTKYYVRVLASTKVGPGVYSESKGKFTNGEPATSTNNSTSSTLSFILPIPAVNFTHFYVVALKSPSDNDEKSPDSFDNAELLTYAEAKKLTNPRPYIAAVITSGGSLGIPFTLGDNKNTSGPRLRRRRSTSYDYRNGPLEPGTSYKIFQRIFTVTGEYYSTDWSASSITDGGLENQSSEAGGNSVGMIVGAVLGLMFVLVIVILAVIFYRRRKSQESSKASTDKDNNGLQNEASNIMYNSAYEDVANGAPKERSTEYESVILPSSDKTTLVDELNNDDKVQEDVYGNQETIIARTHNPIPLAEFDSYVREMKADKNKEFKLDFEDLPTGQKSNWDIAKRSFNAAKNRFGNAVTYSHSRVVLSGNEKNDYINASFIDGITEKYYIATQGPKPKTVYDFWRMIFEFKCPTIVMLTTLKEMGKVKCEKYWPEECNVYGEIKVTTTKSRGFADYVTRTFLVEKDGHQLKVQQFHFKSWPDYGVPLNPTQILTFRRHFKSFHQTKTGPAVVHCSAGVGRTGVFIAVDKVLDGLDKGNKATIDIFGFVKEMRTRRVNMVQTADQYVFIHDTILDHIKCGENEVEATQVMIEIRRLSEKNMKGSTGFEETFQRLNSVSPKIDPEHCEAALLPENRKKNRSPEIYPCEINRVYLQHLEDVDYSDYINACYVDGYLGKNYFIATQTPFKKTIGDFWRMVFQHHSSTIVLLNQLRENDQEYPMFWPTERAKPQSFATTTVMLDSCVAKDDIVIRKFIVSSSADMSGARMVRMIHYMSWPDHGVPENVDDIVKVLSEVEESQRAAEKKGPVVVVCSDGAGRSGTYIAISNLVDRVKVVQVIDVFQCIKLIRSRRPQFVETAAQFKLCYAAVTSVLESFNEYSNFNT